MHWIDPDHLPEVGGTVELFLMNKHGEADGFLMTDGREVHVPPHLSLRLLRRTLRVLLYLEGRRFLTPVPADHQRDQQIDTDQAAQSSGNQAAATATAP